MNQLTILWILVGLAVLGTIIKGLRSLSGEAAPGLTGPVTLDDVKRLALMGRKIQAIKEYRRLHATSLKAAKNAVEQLMAGGSLPEESPAPACSGFDEVRQLAAQGRKIEAIKRYRELTRVGLVEAKSAVECGQYIHPVINHPPVPPTLEEIRATARDGDFVGAVKMYRTLNPSASLADAKIAVEKLMNSG